MGYMRVFARWAGMSPRRRSLLAALALAVAAAGIAGGIVVAQGSQPGALPSSSRPGAVLLVPGYGGSTAALDVLAARIRQTGLPAAVVHLAGDGTGDLRAQAGVLNGYVNQALQAGSGPVTVIGYSAGGVVAWLWDVSYDGSARAARIITLGSPLHGANLATIGSVLAPDVCPAACQELVPGSSLLTWLERLPPQDRPPWLSLWTTDDQVVQPPDSARLPGAVNVPLQSVCPDAIIGHSDLPTSPLVVGIVLRTLSTHHLTAPAPTDCRSLRTLGS
jgi:triacylglycerol lipase